jgi:hypothetical protein
VASLFDRLREKQPQQLEQPAEPEIVRRGPQPIIPPTHSKSTPSEKLLAWIINYWSRPTITLRDIYSYGPNCARDPADRASLIETLTEYGWLVPTEAWRRDMRKFKIIRESGNRSPTQV